MEIPSFAPYLSNEAEMYLRQVQIHNIKAITSLTMDFPEGQEAGWHVVLGDNGTGKSTVIRAIALGLIGPYDQKALRLNLAEWLRHGESSGVVWTLNLRDTRYDGILRKGADNLKDQFWTGVEISRREHATVAKEAEDSKAIPGQGERTLWSDSVGGWFSAGFGPFRRFYGGDPEILRVHFSDPRVSAHLSLFGENVAMSEALTWLRDLHLKRLEKDEEAERLLETLTQFVNRSGLLPFQTQLREISSEGVSFTDGNGVDVPLSSLSDGFRSLLSLIFELIRQFARVHHVDGIFAVIDPYPTLIVQLPGVVLIDEVDAHLHPTWQTRIGAWFTRFFPEVQFIVTTHSPLICRGAAKGTIWKLPAPLSGETFREITGLEKDRLVYGNVLEAYETDEFGEGVSRGEEGKAKQRRYRDLYMKKRFQQDMTDEELAEYAELQTIFQSHVED